MKKWEQMSKKVETGKQKEKKRKEREEEEKQEKENIPWDDAFEECDPRNAERMAVKKRKERKEQEQRELERQRLQEEENVQEEGQLGQGERVDQDGGAEGEERETGYGAMRGGGATAKKMRQKNSFSKSVCFCTFTKCQRPGTDRNFCRLPYCM
jgi:hypothetical protein